MELDHLVPRAEGGSDDIENAIPLCFECHAEVHAYNDKHPRGRKFKSEELRAHKEQWLAICRDRPDALAGAPLDKGVGPLQALVDELDFNLEAIPVEFPHGACPFMTEQFRRAIASGSLSILNDTLRSAVLHAYSDMGAANDALASAHHIEHRPYREGAATHAYSLMRSAKPAILAARDEIMKFVRST